MWKRLPVGEFKWKWEPYFLWHLVGCAGCVFCLVFSFLNLMLLAVIHKSAKHTKKKNMYGLNNN